VATRGAELGCTSKTLLVVALVGFASAAVLAVLVAFPAHYREVENEGLAGLLQDQAWSASYDANLRDATQVRFAILEVFRERNARKANRLAWSLGSLAFGIVFLLAAVVAALVESA
jgi:hypothetical protein